MKRRGKDEPQDDGLYALRRSVVLEVLTRHYVRVGLRREQEELYLLERDEDFLYVSLPGLIPTQMVLRLANTFKIPPDEFYQANREGTH